MKKLEVIQTVESSVSSIYSREDVIKIINMIDDSRKISVTDINRAIDNVIDSLERDTCDAIDYSSAEFTIGYDSRIEVDSINLNFDYIREALENNFMDFGEEDLSTFGPSEESEMH
jgi:hypothetical protein